MDFGQLLSTLGIVTHWSLVVVLGVRLINRRQTPEYTLAWLIVIAAFPIIGPALYLVIAEPWLSARRTDRIITLARRARDLLRERLQTPPDASTDDLHPGVDGLCSLAEASQAMPLSFNNRVDVYDAFDEIFPAMLGDVRAAQHSCDLMFFIFDQRGRVADLIDALIDRTERGVRCRLLVDAVGSRRFLRSPERRALERAGVRVTASLPVRWLRRYAARIDIRNHRKLLIVDETVAWTGSFNIIDPEYFGRERGCGPWVDVMARITGPALPAFDAVFEVDQALETDDDPVEYINRHVDERYRRAHDETSGDGHDPIERPGDSPIQIVPTGPGQHSNTLHRMLLYSVHSAREELVISSPYFMPDPAMLQALIAATARGVRVVAIAPLQLDGPFVGLATRGFMRDLRDQGVDVRLYTEGLLHSKTAVIDNSLCLLGTANLDRRSLFINFELNMFAYDASTTARLREIQQRYIDASVPFHDSPIAERPWMLRTLENAAQLASPIL